MIEIGRIKVIKVRVKNAAGTLVPKLDADGKQEERVKADEIWRETKDVLGRTYGSKERGRKLVAGLVDGDCLVLYPKGTRRTERASLFDIFQWMIRTRALSAQLQKARNTKKAREHSRQMAKLRRTELRLRKPIEE